MTVQISLRSLLALEHHHISDIIHVLGPLRGHKCVHQQELLGCLARRKLRLDGPDVLCAVLSEYNMSILASTSKDVNHETLAVSLLEHDIQGPLSMCTPHQHGDGDRHDQQHHTQKRHIRDERYQDLEMSDTAKREMVTE